MMSRYIYRISGTIYFPEGIMPGEGRQSNVLSIAKDGLGRPVLRGSSLSGALRAEFDNDNAAYWFGRPLESEDSASDDSRVIVADMVLDTGKSKETVRTHNLVNRHTGVVVDGGLFSMELLPPETSAKLLIYINSRKLSSDNNSSDHKPSSDENFILDSLKNIFGRGITLGGNKNRGVGRIRCENNQGGRKCENDQEGKKCQNAQGVTNLVLHKFDVSSPEGYAEWMNARYADRTGKEVAGGEPFDLKSQSEDFIIDVILSIPRGEDIVVGYGATMDHNLEPQRVMKADGKHYWQIQGATFRGIFRGWMSRLAVLDGYTLRDNANQYVDKYYKGDFKKRESSNSKFGKSESERREYKNGELEFSGNNIGWGFVDKNERKIFQEAPENLDDPIMSLFGSLYKKGRIHFTDAYSLKPADLNKDTQVRVHVAVDRFSGGANEGMLFDNRVLVGNIKFGLRITITNPPDDEMKCREIKWLEKSLKALHLGILSFGSNKGSGRLEIESITFPSAAKSLPSDHSSGFTFEEKMSKTLFMNLTEADNGEKR